MNTLHRLFEKYQDPSMTLKCEKYAEWTDPSLFVDPKLTNTTSSTPVTRDWQSFGSLITRHLASKLTQNLFPIGKSFFKMTLADAALDVFQQAFGIGPDDVDAVQASTERKACDRLFERGNYNRLSQGMRNLLVLGNVLLYFRHDGSILSYNTRSYSILRDGTGAPLLGVLKERVAWSRLGADLQRAIPRHEDDDLLDVYTGFQWLPVDERGVRYVEVYQEVLQYTSDKVRVRAELCPFLPLTWDLVPGESYGRGHVEANAGDFARYSSLSQALTLYEAEMCRVVHGVKAGSGADIDALQNAVCGEYVQADPASVQAMEFGDAKKVLELRQELQALEARLGQAFMYGGTVRDSERTTAYEISHTAQEMDINFGGVYSQLSSSLHLPLALLLLREEAPDFVSAALAGQLQLRVVTGVPALGRAGKIASLLKAAQEAAVIVQALQATSQKFSPERIAEACLVANGVDPSEFQRTEEELQALQQQVAPINPTDPENLTAAMQGVMQGG